MADGRQLQRDRVLDLFVDVSAVGADPALSLDEALDAILHLIPSFWQSTEDTVVRISVEDKVFATDNFQRIAGSMSADIVSDGESVGTLEVGCLSSGANKDAAPPHPEEQDLLTSLGRQLGIIIACRRSHEANEVSSQHHDPLDVAAQELLETSQSPEANMRLLEESRREVQSIEANFREIVDSSPDGIVSLSNTGNVLSVNRTFCALTGFKESDLVGRHALKLPTLLPQKLKFYGGMLKKVLAGAPPDAFEFQWRHANGDVRLAEATVGRLKEKGRNVGFQIVVRDITDLRRAEQSLAEQAHFLDRLIESSALSTWISDAEGTAIRTNPACLAFFGATEEEVIGKYNLFKDGVIEAQGFMPTIRKVFEEGVTARIEIDYDFAAVDHVSVKDATHKIVNSTFTPITDNEGRVTNVLVQAIDITDIRRAEEALKDSEARTRAILDATPFPVAVVDLMDDKILYWSRSALTRFGHTASTAGEWYEIAYPDPDYRQSVIERWRPLVEKARETGEAVNTGEYDVTCKDGSVRICELYAAFVGNNLIVTFNDITEQKALAAQLRQADRLTSMGTLAAGVAHEINNPLSYVLYNLESLEKDLPMLFQSLRQIHSRLRTDAGADTLEETLNQLNEAMNRDLIHDILGRLSYALNGTDRIREIAHGLGAFSRVDDTALHPVNLHRVIDTAAEMASNEIRYRANLVKAYGDVPRVLAVEGRLSQVFVNLLINAAHAIEEGAMDENEIRVRTWADGEDVIAEVRDTGVGIPEEIADRLFEPFFTTKEIGSGTGLGLPISKTIVESYGGSITVRSKVGQGTRFTVRLPAQPGTTKPPPERPEARKIAKKPGRILVVDDEKGIRDAMVRMLKPHEVVTAGDGHEAKRIVESDQAFDLILCDMMMPGFSGMDLHLWLSVEHPRLAERVIFITGGAFTPKTQQYLNQIDNLRLEKPFDRPLFQKVVNERIQKLHPSAPPSIDGADDPPDNPRQK